MRKEQKNPPAPLAQRINYQEGNFKNHCYEAKKLLLSVYCHHDDVRIPAPRHSAGTGEC